MGGGEGAGLKAAFRGGAQKAGAASWYRGAEAQRLSGLTDFFAETQGWIGAHLPWPIQPWALRRNPDGILKGRDDGGARRVAV
ncbi:hypothetical protein SBV1_850009 [Verrucomicrobia bacterium]|nr:hypothetical protein SBV1_850009 [Verrucomicrobiota bacterium]